MIKLKIYNNSQAVASTTEAFDITIHKELMREWTLEFTLANNISARQYAIDTNAQYEINGQLYDVKGYDQYSGTQNTTKFKAWHVSARASNYKLTAGYAFVGTIAEIIQDMLTQSGADAEFTVGTCADVSGSFSLEQDATVRSAISALSDLGVEIDYDNFTINAPTRLGSDTGKVLEFGVDLIDLQRHLDKTSGSSVLSYTVSALTGDYVVGDTIGVKDAVIGDIITSKRIVALDIDPNNPTRNSMQIGNWVNDLADVISSMQVDIDNSVQQGTAYSNVKITHEDGVVCTRNDEVVIVKLNATDVLKILKENVMTGGINEDGYFMASLFSMPGYPEYALIVGANPNTDYGRGIFGIKNATTTKDVYLMVTPLVDAVGVGVEFDDGTTINTDSLSFNLTKTLSASAFMALIADGTSTVLQHTFNSGTGDVTASSYENGAYKVNINGTDYLIITPTRTDINTPLYVQNVHITSDRELKENIVEAPESVLSEIEALKFYYYTYINNGADNSMNYGLMADEVPFQMTSDHKTIDIYGGIALALKGAQELLAQFKDYKTATDTEINNLKNKVAALEAK